VSNGHIEAHSIKIVQITLKMNRKNRIIPKVFYVWREYSIELVLEYFGGFPETVP